MQSGNSEKKVLVATTVHNPVDNRIFLKQIASLRQAGWHVEYLSRYEGAPASAERLCPIPVRLPRHRLMRVIAGNFALIRHALFSNARILHVHDPELFLAARLVGWRFRRVVIDLHDLPHEQVRYKPYLSPFAKRLMAFAVAIALRLVLFRATVVIAESSYARWAQKSTNKVVLVRNFPQSACSEPGNQQRSLEKLTLGYVGVLSRARGVDMIASALETIAHRTGKKVLLRLIGSFESAALQSEVTANESVEYCGYRANDEVPALLGDVDVGLALTARTPNYDHSLSTKIPEYILMGLPVIATDNPINRELFSGFPTVRLVDPACVDSFVDQVVDLSQSPPDPSSRRAARERVAKEMSWEAEFDRLLETYESALEQ